MTALDTWMHRPVVQALGAALIHFVWQGALIALLLGIFLLAMRRGSSRQRHAAAALALLLMPLAFLGTLAWAWPAAGGHGGPSVTTGPASWAWNPPGDAAVPVGGGSFWTVLQGSAVWAVPLWFAGVAWFSIRRLGAWLAVRRLRTSGVCAPPREWVERLRALALRADLDRPVSLLESARIDAPAVVGLLKPVILAPAGFFAACPPAEIELILLHELAHVARRDYLVAGLAGLIESVLFYHPAVWWVSGVIQREREHACDDFVVSVTRDAHAYAAALARLEGLRSSTPAPALGAKGGDLLARVRRLLRAPGAESPSPLSGAGLALAAAGLAACLLPTTPAVAQEPLADSPYRHWLSQDAAYIISGEERQTFGNLETDDERNRFVEQFWERRDPTPGTPENEAKEEHYRRIAYANQRFGSTFEGRAPGWLTARGHIYIQHGPPDEIEAHPSGGGPRPIQGIANTDPYEIWAYGQPGAPRMTLTFVDQGATGNYRLFRQVAGQPPAAAQLPQDSPYQRWLTQDVAYVIEDDERAAFQALASEEERRRFVEQFWERRDPTPGTPENEAKEEHYRRIAYANSRYASPTEGLLSGWRTERGRFYVIQGPPDEVEAHPSGGRSRDGDIMSADPWELWIYSPSQGQPEIRALFVRTGGIGDYHLDSQP